ncbi:uncharacterized protein LOC144489480 [Mustelus asterias]
MFLTHSTVRCHLLLLLLFQPGFGLLLNRAKRQANIPPDWDYGELQFADNEDYQEVDSYSGVVSEQRGARRSLIPNFGRPLDRIFSEKRTVPRAHQTPRKRISTPLDQISGSHLAHRREYPDTEWDYNDNEASEPRIESDQQ